MKASVNMNFEHIVSRQRLYLIVDLGDGDFFTLPISRSSAGWAEELLETLAILSYLAGFLLLFTLDAVSSNAESTNKL